MSSIQQRLLHIMRDVESIPKSQYNQKQGYAFRGIDDIYNSLHPIFVEHGVFITHHVLDVEREQIQTSSGSTMISTIVKVEYTFVTDIEYGLITAQNGETTRVQNGDNKLSMVTMGEAFDSGDKSITKAMSMALKTALTQMLLISTGDQDNEATTNPEIKPASNKEKAWLNLTSKDGATLTPKGEEVYKYVIQGGDIDKIYANYRINKSDKEILLKWKKEKTQ